MKYVALVIFVAFFAAAPVYLLNNVVMPQLQQLQTSYASAGAMADKIAASSR